MSWAARYIGIPYRLPDDFPRGTDCWGLVRHVYQRELGVALPDYGEVAAAGLAAVARRIRDESAAPCANPWREVQTGDRFDVVLMSGRVDGARQPVHCGVLVDSHHLLHVERATDSVMVPLTHRTVRHRILSTWRLR